MKATLDIKIFHYLDSLVTSIPMELKDLYESLLLAARRQRMRKLFAQFFQTGDLVYDIGANIGRLSAEFLALGARVLAIEPHPGCAAILDRRFGLSPAMTIIQTGIAEMKGSLPFYISSKVSDTSTFSSHFISHSRYARRVWDKVIQTPVTTLDDLIESHGVPVFIKIDTEGYELNVLKGLSQPIRGISFEFTREMQDEYRDCLTRLARLGQYRFNYSRYQRYSLASREWLDGIQLDQAITSDWTPYLCGDIYCRLDR